VGRRLKLNKLEPMEEQLDSIRKSINVIKVIVVIWFICKILDIAWELMMAADV